jgi:hypothetical protein
LEGFGKTFFLGRHHSPESKQKISNALKGKTLSIETRKKLSETHKGCIPWNKGKKLPAEYRQKIGLASKKCWSSAGYRQKMSKAHKGCIPWNKGKTLSPAS